VSAAQQALTNIERAQLELAACEQRLRDAVAKHGAAKRARETAPSSIAPKQKLLLRADHEAAEEHLAACTRERDAAAEAVRHANSSLSQAETADRWGETESRLESCKAVAFRVVEHQRAIEILEAELAPMFHSYLETSGLIGKLADPLVEHEPGRPRWLADLYREVRRESGEQVPDVSLSTEKGRILANLKAASDAHAARDRARVRPPAHVRQLTQLQRDQLLWALTVRGSAVQSDLLLQAGVSTDALWALAGAPQPGKHVRTDNISATALAQIAAGLPRALGICAAKPLSDSGGTVSAGGPGAPFDAAQVAQLRAKSKTWVEPPPIVLAARESIYLERDEPTTPNPFRNNP